MNETPIDKLNKDSTAIPMITQWELLVLLDGLHGSLRFSDGGYIWRWNNDQRKHVLDTIYTRMNQMPIEEMNAETP